MSGAARRANPAASIRELTMMTRLPSTLPGLPAASTIDMAWMPLADTLKRICSPGTQNDACTFTGTVAWGAFIGGAGGLV